MRLPGMTTPVQTSPSAVKRTVAALAVSSPTGPMAIGGGVAADRSGVGGAVGTRVGVGVAVGVGVGVGLGEGVSVGVVGVGVGVGVGLGVGVGV